jgi:hypothetical protein
MSWMDAMKAPNPLAAIGEAAKAEIGFAKNLLSDAGEAADKLASGDVAGAAVELLEATSVGNVAARRLEALGVIEGDLALNLTSGVINAAALNPLALKDAADVMKALGDKGVKSSGKACPAHTPPRTPAAELARAGGKRKGYAEPMPGSARGDRKIVDVVKGSSLMQPTDSVVNRALEGALRDAGVKRDGAPVKDTAWGSRSIDDILNDPTLSFEDMVAMFMAKVVQDEQKKVRAMMEDLQKAKSADDKDAKGAKGGAGGKAGGAADGGAEGGSSTGGFNIGSFGGTFSDKGMSLDHPLLGQLFSVGFSGGADGGGGGGLGNLNKDGLSGLAGMARDMGPMLTPLVAAGLAMIPPIGPLLAPFAPMLTEMALGALEQGAAQMPAGAPGMSPEDVAKKADAEGAGDSPSAASDGKSLVSEDGAKIAGMPNDQESRALMMEQLKMLMQNMQQMQQAMSNVLNTMHQGSMNAIRNIK